MMEDAFGVHEVDENFDYIELFSFKLAEKGKVERAFHAILNQRVMKSFGIVEREDEYPRSGYVNRRVVVQMKHIDHKLVSDEDLKRMIVELFYASGYQLHFIKWSKFLNLKNK